MKLLRILGTMYENKDVSPATSNSQEIEIVMISLFIFLIIIFVVTFILYWGSNILDKIMNYFQESHEKKLIATYQNQKTTPIEKMNKADMSSNTRTAEEESRTYTQKITSEKKTGIKNEVIEINDIELGDEQKSVYKLMNNSKENLFITGKAGTGKSILLQYFVKHTSKQVAVVAPTGVAALNVGGQTIHSFFKMGLDTQDPDNFSQVSDMGYKRKEILNGIQTLVIDEISMVSADVMDMIDTKLKYARDNKEPFGGCQIIVFGDLYQLPPVVSSGQVFRYLEDRYTTSYFFGADEIRKNPFKIIELQHVFRQKDQTFIDILNKIRLGEASNALLDDINSCCVIPPEDEQYITLTGDNATANTINREKLLALNTKEYVYTGKVVGDIKQSSMPTDLHLHLKVGAHVMMIKNDRTDNSSNDKREKARWVNGTLGVVSELSSNSIKVEINGVSHWIDKEKWEKYQYRYNTEEKKLEKNVVATFTQYPIKLAYAITIHKSQGQTYDAVKIDLSKGAFAAGQTYVALSRCRSMESLYLTKALRREDIKVSQEVINYMKGRVVEPSKKTSLYDIKNVRQRSDDWRGIRQGKVTGSTAFYLKHHSVSFAIRKGIMLDSEDYTNEAMQRGRELESIGIAKFARGRNQKVESVGFINSVTHKAAGFSPDGVIYGEDGKIKTIVEHKAFSEKRHLSCYKHVDDRVMYQIQFGLFVTGAKDAYLVLYNPDLSDVESQLLIKHIEKDLKIQELFENRFKEYEEGENNLTDNSIRVVTGERVLQYNDNGEIIAEFESMADASKKTGIGYYSIRDVMRGRQKHAGGYGWIYKKDYSGNKEDLIIRSSNKRPVMTAIPVYQCDDNGRTIAEFKSIYQAEHQTGVSATDIKKVLQGKQKLAGGYKWKSSLKSSGHKSKS